MRLFRFQHPGPRDGHLLPHEPIAIVKPIVVNQAYRKAGMPDYWNVEKSPAILTFLEIL